MFEGVITISTSQELLVRQAKISIEELTDLL